MGFLKVFFYSIEAKTWAEALGEIRERYILKVSTYYEAQQMLS